jgi:hypothetical protein
MRKILQRTFAALRGFLVGFTGMPSARLAGPTRDCDGASDPAGTQRALETRSRHRGGCC